MTDEVKQAMERRFRYREWLLSNMQDPDPYLSSESFTTTAPKHNDLAVLADAYLAEHTPEREAERRECIEWIKDNNQAFFLRKGGAIYRRLLAFLESNQ